MPPQFHGPDDELLRPREVAALLGVRTATIARWARQGRLSPLLTPGGHRRYTLASVRAVLDEEPAEPAIAEDAARLYEQGWSIRQVAQRFGCEYGVMRRMLRRQVTLRTRGGRERALP